MNEEVQKVASMLNAILTQQEINAKKIAILPTKFG